MRALTLLLLIVPALAEDLRWLAPAAVPLTIHGLPFFPENGGELYRLPVKLKDTFRPPVWNLALSPAGGRIRFRTDSPKIAIRVEYPSAPNMTNMHAFGQTGVDLYADGVYAATAIADKEAKPGKVIEKVYFENRSRAMRNIDLYLPLYKPVKVLAIGVAEDAKLEPARPFRLDRPLVFYGTSITQGGCASRSGMSYQAILGRALNLDHVNLGFSGNGIGEPELARIVASIDASCYVLDFMGNNKSVESLRPAYRPFVETIRAKHPDTPILAVTMTAAASDRWDDEGRARKEAMREHIRLVVSERIAAGDRNIRLVEGTDLLGMSRLDGLVDGVHPNDLGFQWMADGLAERLRDVLGLR